MVAVAWSACHSLCAGSDQLANKLNEKVRA